jgi:hypothetical protein
LRRVLGIGNGEMTWALQHRLPRLLRPARPGISTAAIRQAVPGREDGARRRTASKPNDLVRTAKASGLPSSSAAIEIRGCMAHTRMDNGSSHDNTTLVLPASIGSGLNWQLTGGIQGDQGRRE